MCLQQSDPIFNVGVDVMRPAFNFEPKYRVSVLTREAWTKGSGAPAVKGLVGFTDGSRTREGTGTGIHGQSAGRRLNFSLGRYVITVFQAEIYAILACLYKIQFQNRPE